MNVDQWLTKKYDRTTYNCVHFAGDVWAWATGEDASERLAALWRAATDNRAPRALFRAFERLQRPVSPCFVYLLQLHAEPHIGVYLNGKMLHITKRGPEFFPLHMATRGFTEVRFYK